MMKATSKWILGGVASLAIAGAVFAGPALAADGSSMMGSMMNGAMSSMMGSDMMEMHNTMAPLMAQMPAMQTEMMGEVGKLFGMTGDELTQATKDGKSLLDLAAEKNVAPGEIRATMTRGMQAFLDRAVTDGSITQAQAGKILGYMEKRMDACLSSDMSNMMSMMSSGDMSSHHSSMMGGSK